MQLDGKDYLTTKEAANYCCVSFSQFRVKSKEFRLLPGRFMGKFIYRKIDLKRLIEDKGFWPH